MTIQISNRRSLKPTVYLMTEGNATPRARSCLGTPLEECTHLDLRNPEKHHKDSLNASCCD